MSDNDDTKMTLMTPLMTMMMITRRKARCGSDWFQHSATGGAIVGGIAALHHYHHSITHESFVEVSISAEFCLDSSQSPPAGWRAGSSVVSLISSAGTRRAIWGSTTSAKCANSATSARGSATSANSATSARTSASRQPASHQHVNTVQCQMLSIVAGAAGFIANSFELTA